MQRSSEHLLNSYPMSDMCNVLLDISPLPSLIDGDSEAPEANLPKVK